MPLTRWQTAAKAGAATVLAGSSAGTATWAAYRHLMSQATSARSVIGKIATRPPEADGVYTAGSRLPERWRMGDSADIHLMVFGDSMAAGVGCAIADEVPGVLVARGLAEETGKQVRLSTKAIPGATSKGLEGQVDAMFVAGPPPDAAVILVGANDVTKKFSIGASAARLGDAVGRLTAEGTVVVVGTCPDLGVVTAIPQPLRTIVRNWGRRLARAQTSATLSAGGHPVALDLLAPEFYAAPDRMLSEDRFHPSAAGYELAARQLLAVLAAGLGEWDGGPLPQVPEPGVGVDARGFGPRAAASRDWLLRRRGADISGSNP